MFGQSGRGRLHADKLIGRLRAVAERQLRLRVQIGRFLNHLKQIGDGKAAQQFAGAVRMAHVALDESRIGAADLGQRFAAGEVDHLVHVQALVRLAPTKNGDVNHGWFPWDVRVANSSRAQIASGSSKGGTGG